MVARTGNNTYLCSVNKKLNRLKNQIVMSIQVLIWSSVMLFLLVGFVLRIAVNTRLSSGNGKIFEVSDEFEIYDLNEDEA